MKMLTQIKEIIEPLNSSDGAGVKLKRSIGTQLIDYFDPFLMLDEFGSENKDDYIGGFPPHPHRGIETVTYMLSGAFEHEDSTGAKGVMKSGDVQWMKTGRGIIHSEMPAMTDGKLHGFQLWINMPAKLKRNKPEYVYLKSEELGYFSDENRRVRIIAGEFNGIKGPITNHNVEPIYFDVELDENAELSTTLNENHNSLIYLIDGHLNIGDTSMSPDGKSYLIILDKSDELKIKAKRDSKFLIISGKPINEQIARGGPFVMNTKEEIAEAIHDYHNGTFAKY